MGQGEQNWIKADNLVDLACRNRSDFQHIHRGVVDDREREKR
jgi:hypothetical protein